MFYLVCGYHPFEDSAKLAILNANFNLPPCDAGFEPFHNLIREFQSTYFAIFVSIPFHHSLHSLPKILMNSQLVP